MKSNIFWPSMSQEALVGALNALYGSPEQSVLDRLFKAAEAELPPDMSVVADIEKTSSGRIFAKLIPGFVELVRPEPTYLQVCLGSRHMKKWSLIVSVHSDNVAILNHVLVKVAAIAGADSKVTVGTADELTVADAIHRFPVLKVA